MAEVIRRGDRVAWQTPVGSDDARRLEEAPVGELLSGFVAQGRRLIQEELHLAKAELKQNTAHLGRDVGAVGAGGVLVHTGWLVLAGALVALLTLALPLWSAALIVALAFIAAGGLVSMAGMKRLKHIHGPTETVQTLKEDKQWAKQTARDAKSKMHAST